MVHGWVATPGSGSCAECTESSWSRPRNPLNRTCWFDSAHVGFVVPSRKQDIGSFASSVRALLCRLYSLGWGHLSPCRGGSRGHIEEWGLLCCFDGSLEGSTDIFRALKVVLRPSLGGVVTRLCSHGWCGCLKKTWSPLRVLKVSAPGWDSEFLH